MNGHSQGHRRIGRVGRLGPQGLPPRPPASLPDCLLRPARSWDSHTPFARLPASGLRLGLTAEPCCCCQFLGCSPGAFVAGSVVTGSHSEVESPASVAIRASGHPRPLEQRHDDLQKLSQPDGQRSAFRRRLRCRAGAPSSATELGPEHLDILREIEDEGEPLSLAEELAELADRGERPRSTRNWPS